jgi:hypothetical protein
MDKEWWRTYKTEVLSTFSGELYGRFAEEHVIAPPTYHGGNSGAGAILLAAHFGAKKIILLGYDCSTDSGSHWHGKHPDGMGNCESIAHWPRFFADVKRMLPNVEIINASRQTKLDIWPCMPLEDAL